MELSLIGGAGAGRAKSQNNLVCQNFIIDVDEEGNIALIGTPGLKEFSDTGHEAEIRGGLLYDSSLIYIVVGNRFYSVNSSGTATQISGTLDTSSGRVTVAKNDGQIGIVDGSEYYLWKESTNTLAKQARPVLPTPESIEEQDGYFIFNIDDSDTFYISGLNDGESISALDYASAEASPDKTKIIVSDHSELWHFGEETTEPFYNSGNTDFPFERVPGAKMERGIKAAATVAKIDNTLMWLDNFDQIVRANGYTPVVVSTPAISYQISKLSTKTDATAYSYSQEGHWYYVLTFPTDGETFVYDALTKKWTTRASGVDTIKPTQIGETTVKRHRGNIGLLFNGEWIIGDYENGKLYEFDFDTYTDDGEVIVSKFMTRAKSKGRKLMRHSSIELEAEVGVGLETGTTDPQVVMRFSDNYGKTWSNERWRSLGKLGDNNIRVRWEKLGVSRDRIYEFTITDPVKRIITGVYLNE